MCKKDTKRHYVENLKQIEVKWPELLIAQIFFENQNCQLLEQSV
jgi:hypothetical protein